MAEMLTTIDVSKWQDPEQLDWAGLKKQGLKSIIIQLSHGMKREEKADQFLAKAKTEGLIAHGYHFYEGSTDEANFAVQNAQQLGLGKGAYFFLDMEGDIAGDWYQQFSVFYSLVAQSGWNPGLYVSDSPYKVKFDNDQLVSMGVYRWIASYGKEPANYDVWQYASSNGKLDVDYDKAGKLEVDYTKNQSEHHDDSKYEPAPRQPQKPMANSWVGWGVDSSGLGGGRTIGYSTDGKNFYAVFTPWGITFRQSDADHMWELLKSRIKLPSVEGLVKKAELNNYALKSDLPDLSKFAKISDIPKVDLSGYAKITDLVHTKDLADYVKTKDLPKPLDLSGYALKSQIPSLDGYAKLTDIPSLTGYLKQSALADYAKKSDIPRLDDYAKKSDIPDLSGYAKRSEIPSITGLATKVEAQQAQSTADSATTTAESAKNIAQQAQSTAVDASSKADQALTAAQNAQPKIDSSSQTTIEKPSAYTEGFSYEIKTFDSLGIDKSKIASELVQGKVVWLTTKKYSDYARQMAEVIDSPTPATFFRNGTKDSWSNWVVSQLTAFS